MCGFAVSLGSPVQFALPLWVECFGTDRYMGVNMVFMSNPWMILFLF